MAGVLWSNLVHVENKIFKTFGSKRFYVISFTTLREKRIFRSNNTSHLTTINLCRRLHFHEISSPLAPAFSSEREARLAHDWLISAAERPTSSMSVPSTSEGRNFWLPDQLRSSLQRRILAEYTHQHVTTYQHVKDKKIYSHYSENRKLKEYL